jgi:glycerol kinase
VLLNIGSEARVSARGVLTALAWVRGGVPTYALEGIIISSAATLNWLRDQLCLARNIRSLERMAHAVDDNGGVYLVPAFTGLGLPHWRPEARAIVTGLSSHSDRRHVARAAFESIAYQFRVALDAMRAEAGVPLASLHADGGPTANRFLMQFTADLIRAELRVATMPDYSALGAVLAGRVGQGGSPVPAQAVPTTKDERVYFPAADRTAATESYRGWQRAVRQVTLATETMTDVDPLADGS